MAYRLKDNALRDAFFALYGAKRFETELTSDAVTEALKIDGAAVLHFENRCGKNFEPDSITITKDMVIEEDILPAGWEGRYFGDHKRHTDFYQALFYFVEFDNFGDGSCWYVTSKPCEGGFLYEVRRSENGKVERSFISPRVPNAESAYGCIVLHKEEELKEWERRRAIERDAKRRETNGRRLERGN